MKKLIHFREWQYKQTLYILSATAERLNVFIKAYDSLSLEPLLDNNKFVKLFTESEELLFDKMTKGSNLSLVRPYLIKPKFLILL